MPANQPFYLAWGDAAADRWRWQKEAIAHVEEELTNGDRTSMVHPVVR